MGRVRIAGNQVRVVVLGILALVLAGALVAALGASRSGDAVQSVAGGSTEGFDMPLSAPAESSGGVGNATRSGSSGGATPGIASDQSTAKQIGPVPPDGGSTPVPGSPRIVRTGELRVNVGKSGFDAAFDRVASIAAAHGGFVASSSTSSNSSGGDNSGGGNDARSGDLVVRVPSDRFDSARRDLAALGKVEYQALRGEDVSGQLVDYDARLKSLTAQEDALRTLVGKATAVGEVLQVQNSLFEVRQQIEQLTAQKQNLEQAASLSTIQVSVFEPGALFEPRPVDDDKGLANAFERAVDGSVAVIGGMMVVVGWAVPIVVLGLVVWAASRLFRRRPPRAGAPGGPPSPTPAPSTP